MEKAEYKEQLDLACEKFRKLMADQLTRVEDTASWSVGRG